MSLNRREFIGLTATGLASGLLMPTVLRAQTKRRLKAVLFDLFTVFDPRTIAGPAEQLFPGKGVELSHVWQTKQFNYAWLRSITNHYEDFWKVTGDALDFAAASLKLNLTSDKRERLMQGYAELKPYSDVPDALKPLKTAGVKLVFLSNFSDKMLEDLLANSGLQNFFDKPISTDSAKAYKPDPKAYQLGVDKLGLTRDDMAFAAFGGWDAAGAKWFGYPTFWVNRLDQPTEQLGAQADKTGKDLGDLVDWLRPRI